LFIEPALAAGMRSGRRGRERAQEDVHDPLRGLDVAARDGGGERPR
jgi:hypothetical protein